MTIPIVGLPQILFIQGSGLGSSVASPICPPWLPRFVLVHAPFELFDRLFICLEDHSLVPLLSILTFLLWIVFRFILGQGADFVAENFTLLRNFSIVELFEQLFLPLFAAVAAHGVHELSIRADTSDVDA